MASTEKNIGKWKAWTYPHDFNPHVYIEGEVPTNKEKPIFSLSVLHDHAAKPGQIVFALTPDAVDIAGANNVKVQPFSGPLHFKSYDSVLIKTATNEIATIEIEKKDRGLLAKPEKRNPNPAGCWVTFYENENYEGRSITVNGPAEYNNLRSLPGAGNYDWGDKFGSLRIGPTAWVRLYNDEDYNDDNFTFGPGSSIRKLPNDDDTDSFRIFNNNPEG